MNILGLDTCFPALAVAVGAGLGSGGAHIHARTEPMATGHAERMMPLIGELLAEARLRITDIDRIVVTIGPGSFTGTRIGIAAARALKLARGLPVVTFTSLEAIALSPDLEPAPGEDLVIAMDAHRGEAYAQVFEGAGRAATAGPRIVAMSGLASLSSGRPVLAAGTAAEAVATAINAAGGKARVHAAPLFPDMRAAVLAAVTRAPATTPAEPLYLRPPDAKPQDGKSLARTAT